MKKTKLKTVGAAVLAAAMCAAVAGCAKEEPKTEPTDSEIESRLESIFEEADTAAPAQTPEEASAAEPEIVIEMTEEIKSAALNSGLIQLNNDIFQRGGYITVKDFVEKYKDDYDIIYCYRDSSSMKQKPYDECKDYLLMYDERESIFLKPTWEGRLWSNRDQHESWYYLILNPKNGGELQPVWAYVVNATSPDEKITLEEAIVAEVQWGKDDWTPAWIPMGLNSKKVGLNYKHFKDDYESENINYTAKNIGEALEAKGLRNDSSPSTGLSEELIANGGFYWIGSSGNICGYVVGEENLFGARPVYYYIFSIDPNTDKLTGATCTLEYFIKANNDEN